MLYDTACFSFLQIYIFFREKQLRQLLKCYEENEVEMTNALAADLRKHKQEAIVNEIDILKNDIRNLLIHLKEWTSPEKVTTSISNRL